MVKICYSNSCPNELWSGECGGHRYGPCPEALEDGEDYHEALERWEDDKADAAEYRYEMMMEERYEI